MLGDPKPNAGGRRIARADLDIDIAHRRVERAGIRVPDLRIERHDRPRRKRHARQFDTADVASRVISPPRTGEDHHAADARLEAGRVVPEKERRTRASGAQEAHRRPYQNRATDPVTTGGKKHDAPARRFSGFIERALNRIRVVRSTVTLALDSDCTRLSRRYFENRCRGKRRRSRRSQRSNA
jgi:hypothetical protein